MTRQIARAVVFVAILVALVAGSYAVLLWRAGAL